jgi:uncharacterized membrane protein
MDQKVHDLAQQLLRTGFDNLPDRDCRILERLAKRTAITRNVNDDYDATLTFGQQLADRVASFGGSWAFILLFLGFLGVWVIINSVVLAGRGAFDPYPFIFLNLMLSMVAALQAPVIMMSQNRQSIKDRLDAAHDYEVNLRAEMEIGDLHRKIERLEGRLLEVLDARPSPAVS